MGKPLKGTSSGTWTNLGSGLLSGYTYSISASEGIVHVYTSDGVHIASYEGSRRIPVATQAETNQMLDRVLKKKDESQ